MHLAGKALARIQDQMHMEAIAIAGEDYLDKHSIEFGSHETMEMQFENMGEVRGPGLEDVLDYAAEAAAEASKVFDSPVCDPLPLPSEDIIIIVAPEEEEHDNNNNGDYEETANDEEEAAACC